MDGFATCYLVESKDREKSSGNHRSLLDLRDSIIGAVLDWSLGCDAQMESTDSDQDLLKTYFGVALIVDCFFCISFSFLTYLLDKSFLMFPKMFF